MNKKIKDYLGIAGIGTLITLAILFIVATYATYTIAQGINPAQYRNFSVSAEGKVSTVPDVAQFSFSVITEGGVDAESLQSENSKKSNKILAILKKGGVKEKNIKTSNYSITPRYTRYSCNNKLKSTTGACPPSVVTGYTISQSISVKIYNFENIGSILSKITSSGVNRISGPYFKIDDQGKAIASAREKAIKKAKNNAQQLADSGGFKLGKLISIQDSGNYRRNVVNNTESFSIKQINKENTPTIKPGTQDIKVSVTLIFQIK